jgi:hypothetical protein
LENCIVTDDGKPTLSLPFLFSFLEIKLDLDGIDFHFQIKHYQKNNRKDWDDQCLYKMNPPLSAHH